jgi:hypothetical protein
MSSESRGAAESVAVEGRAVAAAMGTDCTRVTKTRQPTGRWHSRSAISISSRIWLMSPRNVAI